VSALFSLVEQGDLVVLRSARRVGYDSEEEGIHISRHSPGAAAGIAERLAFTEAVQLLACHRSGFRNRVKSRPSGLASFRQSMIVFSTLPLSSSAERKTSSAGTRLRCGGMG